VICVTLLRAQTVLGLALLGVVPAFPVSGSDLSTSTQLCALCLRAGMIYDSGRSIVHGVYRLPVPDEGGY
jgi:hypothetical protein